MAIYRQIYLTFWTDTKVVNDFTPEDKYFYLYLMTNPHTNLCGCYEVSIKQMAWETGYNEDTVSRLIERFTTTHNIIRYSKETREVLVLNWHKYNWTKSPKLVKSIEANGMDIKDESFKKYIFDLLKKDTVSIGYTYGMDTSVTVPVPDTVSVTVPVIDAYCKSKGYKIDPHRFFEYYTTDGRTFPTNWQSVVDKWQETEYTKKPKSKKPECIEREVKPNPRFGMEYINEAEA